MPNVGFLEVNVAYNVGFGVHRQQAEGKIRHGNAYYINNQCLRLTTNSMLIMGFVRKNSSQMRFTSARESFWQGKLRE